MKVLIISTVGLIYDGITSVILSYLQAMDLSGLKIYLIGTIEVKPQIREKLSDLDCTIIDLPSRREHPILYFFKLIRVISKEKIKIMHVHGNSGTMAIEMLAGCLAGCKKRIAHSHNTRCNQVNADKILRPLFHLLYTDAVACGTDAGKWLFGNRIFRILKNGRDINKYKFNSQIREKVRREYNLENCVAIGHVGGFVEQKNHEFLIDVYRAIIKKCPRAMFFLVGDGELRQEMQNKVNSLGLNDKIIFTGNTDRVHELLQAMDGMILPSHFEGLPLVVIEWQIAGLPCVLSSNITQECKILDNVFYLSLEENCDFWAENTLRVIRDNNNREEESEDVICKVREAGFDVIENAKILKEMYLS